MNKAQYLNRIKESLNEIMDITPYDLMNFNSREEEKEYINNKTSNFDITHALLDTDGNDGIIVISKKCQYAISPIFIHNDAFVKLLKYITKEKKSFFSSDPVDYFTKKGFILIRLVNNNEVIGFDSYIPDELNDYQVIALENITRELNHVYKELEDIDEMNAKNIKYGINTIKESVKEASLTKQLKLK